MSEVLKQRKPYFKTYAIEPEESPVLSGGTPGPHKIQGIGAGFVPDILETELIDSVIKVSSDEAMKMARELARLEEYPVGYPPAPRSWPPARLPKCLRIKASRSS